ncbi:hypothetical protein U9M48_005558 [Paspalum notatum var. saurae]|uniref:Non-specific lipid-transfer protein n=1 Tax=Paspalum notatum var. saurae TaxID=547442 RepID=A0AAQ3SLV3_PASNO
MARAQVVVIGVVAAVLLAAAASEATLTCGQVSAALGPCLPFAKGSGSAPSAGCCNGVRSLHAAAATVEDRRTACECLKAAAARISGLKPGNGGTIAARCGVSVPYHISPSIDCNRDLEL